MKPSCAVLLAIVLATAGCGSSEEDDARAAVEEYMEAVAERDADDVCEVMAPYPLEGGVTCERLMQQGWAEEGVREADVQAGLRDAKVTAVRIDGEFGTVETSMTREPFHVVRIDDDWYIDTASTD